MENNKFTQTFAINKNNKIKNCDLLGWIIVDIFGDDNRINNFVVNISLPFYSGIFNN